MVLQGCPIGYRSTTEQPITITIADAPHQLQKRKKRHSTRSVGPPLSTKPTTVLYLGLTPACTSQTRSIISLPRAGGTRE